LNPIDWLLVTVLSCLATAGALVLRQYIPVNSGGVWRDGVWMFFGAASLLFAVRTLWLVGRKRGLW